MNSLIAILGLAFLVLVHEAGHFFSARLVGMQPRKFYVGFPPAAVKLRRKGIEYGIGAIPLGGYVKIPGMHRPAPSDVDGRPLGIRQRVGDRNTHVGVTEMREGRAVTETDEGMDHRGRLDDDLDAGVRKRE